MDNVNKLDTYRPDPMYNSDRTVDKQELSDYFTNWDQPYPPGGNPVMSSAELAKTVETMDVVKDNVETLIEDMDRAISEFSGFEKIIDKTSLADTEIVILRRNDPNLPEYILRFHKSGQDQGKLKIASIYPSRDEIDLVVARDGNFQLTRQRSSKDDFAIEAFSTLPRDTKIGFKRMTPQATKTAIGLVNQFLKAGHTPHQPQPPNLN